jgi:hypothetical protein
MGSPEYLHGAVPELVKGNETCMFLGGGSGRRETLSVCCRTQAMSKRTDATVTGLSRIHEGREPPTEGTTRAIATAASPTCTIDREEGSGEETSI